eukprot:CAMPEP_0204831730 /NCGR_PEP_ID=MMETSP1346-20131115/11378_1 /ASSEMBLY_ACC=CAM_ASM_000771 /TAXON_ID=215587 /ORGANISM="Aplanochytrium stocchinoi, Strain GSBS06" /LENGTH=283 /DNA_ID=CAMNT_0051962979 /DNA_START=296 /DNA_END=1147 /DNA_ORIENTATION=+
MEDAHTHLLPTKNNDSLGFFGVFDGHGGDLAAIFAAKHVLTFIENSEAFDDIDENLDPEILARAMMEGFIDCDEDMKEIPVCRSGQDFSGSTGVACFITPDYVVVANTGDSRLAICKDSKVAFASMDHKPNDERERQRVENAGGIIADDRVNGDLASARSFGDFRYKLDPNLPPSQQQITVLPDCTILDRSPEDEFIIVACDGIWDVMSNLEATRYVLTALKMGLSLAKTAEMVLDECLRKSSGDNMSIMIIGLDNLPPQTGTLKNNFPTSDEIREAMVDSII